MKAGFKKDLLVGDDFCKRLLETMMKETTAEDMTTSFRPFVGKLDVTPGINLDGTIRIDFENDRDGDHTAEYRGWFSLDPQKCSPEWFRKAIKKHVTVNEWGDGVKMELNNGKGFNTPLFLSINYVPSNKSERPSKEDTEKLFRRMLVVLDGWLK